MQHFLEKAVAALPLGGLVGLWIELILFPGEIHEYPPFQGLLMGALVFTILCWGFRSVDFSGIMKRMASGALIGMVIALLIGASVYPEIKASMIDEKKLAVEEPGAWFMLHSEFRHKYTVRWVYQGFLYGLPIGAILGILAGLGFHVIATKVKEKKAPVRS